MRGRDRLVVLACDRPRAVLLGGVILTRFDLVPAALVALAAALMATGRLRSAAFVVGVGIAVKLLPGVLVPLLAVAAGAARVDVRRVRRRRARGRPVRSRVYVALPRRSARTGSLDSFGRQLGRPLQIESLGAGVLLALHHAVGMSLEWSSGSGSQNLTGTRRTRSPCSRASRRSRRWRWCGSASRAGLRRRSASLRYAAAALVAFVALSKVLSPQFLVWLVLLVPLVGGVRSRAAVWLTVLACALTAAGSPRATGTWCGTSTRSRPGSSSSAASRS